MAFGRGDVENVQALLPEEIREAIAPYWRVLDQRLEQGHFEQGGAEKLGFRRFVSSNNSASVGSVCGRPFVSWRAAIATSLACSSDVAPAGQAGRDRPVSRGKRGQIRT